MESKIVRKDSRLFRDDVLYSEGLHKPYFRGKIHLIALITFPFYFCHFLQIAGVRENRLALFAGCANIAANCFCFFASALYHGLKWTAKTEIKLQKLDHMSITLWCHFMMYPIAFLLFPKKYGYPFILINTVFAIINCVNIYYSQPSIVMHSLVSGALVPFLPVCWYYMSQRTWWYAMGVYFFQCLGTAVFVSKKTPRIFNIDYFSFHEIFHVLTLGSSLFVYLTNYEIVKGYVESCNDGVY